MQRKRIARRNMQREQAIAGDLLGGGDDVESSHGQHWQVQRLADVARGFGTIGVLVEQAAASREI